MKCITALLVAVVLVLCTVGCSEKRSGKAVLTACEYAETGRMDGSYLSLTVTRKTEAGELEFRASAGAETEPLDVRTAVLPDVLDRAAETAERWGMKDWTVGAALTVPEDGVTALRLTYADGTRLYLSTADELPEGGEAALDEMRETLFSAATTEGAPVFGGEDAPVDLSVLAAPEPAAEDVAGGLSEEGKAVIGALREQTTDAGGVYAVAFLGSPDTSGGGVASDRGYLTLMLQAEGYDDLTFLAELPVDRFVELSEGRTLYMVLALDPAAEIEVYRGTTAARDALVFRGDGELPLVLRCGADPTVQDALVVISASDGSVTELSPGLTDEGQIVPLMRGYDCSAYNRAVG
ncbi:MAG: hypothetical protein IKH56_01515 [Oscillospiraceae bacterium]|nr:hypothetical protein [Oscillospiraceae bacterium]